MSGLGGRTASFKDLASGGSTSAPDQRPRAIPGMGSKVMSFGTLSADAATEESRRELMWQLMSSYLPRDVESIQRYIVNHIEYSLARTRYNFDNYGCYQATALSVRDRLIETFNDTKQFFDEANPKMCYYLSMEFLMGRSLQNALYNLGLKDKYSEALTQLGFQLEDLYELEKDAALGNGGLGRLAACFLDSMATQNYPAWGYGIRYKYGMFKQGIMDGYQIEGPDYWLQNGNPWEVPRLDLVYPVRFYGTVRQERGRAVWEGGEIVEALAYDNPIPGYDTYNCINLRLWSGKPGKEFDLASFNEGDYVKAIEAKQRSENISSVLYPNDHTDQGKELRLRQQYFFVSATLQDVIKRFKGRYQSNPNWKEFPTKVAIQLNDTHPTIGIPELMRILMDLEGLSWDEAWAITEATFGYTNHTVLPEALEKWSVPLFQSLLPRHLQIIYDINWKLMQAVQARYPRDYDRMSRMSIIEEGDTKHPHGEPRRRRLARDERRGGPPLGARQEEPLPRLRRVLRGAALPEQDERRDAAPLAAADQPGAHRDHLEVARDVPVGRQSRAPRRPPQVPGQQGPSEGVRGREAGGEGEARGVHREGQRRQGLPRRPLRRPGQAHPRVQAPAPQHPRHHRAVQQNQVDVAAGPQEHPAQGLHPGREGGAGVLHGEAHHQAGERRRQAGQQRPRRRRPPQGRLPGELQRVPGVRHHPRERHLGAHLHRRHGGVGHVEHEVRHERRPHHRHPRRRQHRDPRGGRRRHHVHLRPPHREGRRGAAQDALRPAPDGRPPPQGPRPDPVGHVGPHRQAPAHPRHLQQPQRQLHRRRGLRLVHGRPGRDRQDVQEQGGVVPPDHQGRFRHGQVLVGPHHPRVRQGHLGHRANAVQPVEHRLPEAAVVRLGRQPCRPRRRHAHMSRPGALMISRPSSFTFSCPVLAV